MSGISKQDLQALRQAIPRGGYEEILKIVNKRLRSKGEDAVSYPTISAVMNGYAFRQDVIDAAVKYLNDLKASQQVQAAINGEKIKKAIAS